MIHKKKQNNRKLYSASTQKYSGNELLTNETINSSKTKKNKSLIGGGNNNVSLGRKLFGAKIETESINYERFEVANKEQFKQLKTDVRATRIAAFIAHKFGRINKLQYKLQIHLLKANLFFARMKLYNAKLTKIANLLVYDENSIIKSIHNKIIEIFELEKQINEGYISKNGTQTTLKPKKLLKLIKDQDKIRYDIMKLTTFEDSSEITKGCTSQGKAMFYNKKKEFICILGRYRKYESKFNKYYNKFKLALEGYFSVYPNCSGAIKEIKLKAIDITKISDEEGLFQDETKCDTENMYKAQAKAFEEVVKASATQLGEEYEGKTIGKAHKLSEDYITSSKSLENTVTHFNTKLEQFKNFFKSLEFFGIHRYPGLLPRKKIAFQSLRGKKSYQLVNPKKLQELSQDKVFVQDFSEMIKKISKDAKDIFTPLDTEITKIVPNITIKPQITKPAPAPAPGVPSAPAPIIYNTSADFGVISINMAKFDSKKLSLESLFAVNADTFNYPIIICVNSGSDDMVNRDSAFNKSFLGNLYIPIAFSSYGNVESKKYNIIFLRKDAIEVDINNPEYLQTLQPIDQSSRFFLNELPEGMTLENNQKSYAVANIIFNDTSNGKAGICVVCTELVGSNPDDLYYAKKVINFNLRAKQINNILETINKFNGRKPDLIIGDLGGCDSNIIRQIINPTPAPLGGVGGISNTETYSAHLWQYFKTNYPDFIPNFQNATALEAFFTNGFNLLTSSSYNADSFIPINPYIAPTTGPNYTKKVLQTLSNYIFYSNSIGKNLTQPITLNTNVSVKNINNYGGNLPIYISYNVSANVSQILGKAPPLQSRIKIGEKIKLFTEKELQGILATIDQLMSVFAYGKVPYMRRDLGCFSLRDDNLFGNKKIPKLYDKQLFGSGKSLLKTSIQDINYKHLDKVMNFEDNIEGIERLKTFYTMNFPAVIECFLFQKTGFFAANPKEKDEIGYYSENQTVMTVDNEGKLETMPEFGNKLKMLKQEGLVNPDIAIRMFLIPSSHIKLIMDIDLRNQLTNQISAKDFKKLTKLALQNFYGKSAINLLEARLSELLERTTHGDNNIIAHLLELTPEGNLKNLNNPKSGEIILDLFEMIFIFLRMKFIDKQMELYDVEVKELEKPLVEIEGIAKQSSKYEKDALGVYQNISDVISTNPNSLEILLYSEKVDRLSKPEYQLNPLIIPNSDSLAEIIESFSHKDIKHKPIDELEKGGITGLQYYEAYLSSLLGKRINKIAHVLKVQTITDAVEYKEFFEKDLPANLDNLLNDARILQKSIQSTDISDVAIGNKIFGRIVIVIKNLKQLNEEWVSYFENIITLLGYYYTAIQYLIIYENTIEDATSSSSSSTIKPTINDLFKHDNIFKEIKHIRNKVFEDTPDRKSIITQIRIPSLQYKLTQDMETVANQIQQIYDRINSRLQSEVRFSLIHSLKSIDKYSSKQIFIQYPVSIYHVALRSTYLMFNKIIELFSSSGTNTNTNTAKENYEHIMRICDSIEISFSEISKIRARENKALVSVGKSISINKNDIIYFENQEILTKLTRMIWAICNLLKDGETSYDSVKIAGGAGGAGAVINKLNITELFESIINSIKQLNDKLNFEVREICYYIMKPINLVVNLMYYITNVFTKYISNSIKDEELVITTTEIGGTIGTPKNSLFNRYKKLLSNGSNEHLYKAIYSFRNNPDSNKKMIDEIKRIFTVYNSNSNSKFNDLYLDTINLINNNNFHLNGEYSLANLHLHLNANNLKTDEIIDTVVNTKINYNEFLLKSISNLQKQDDNICSLIRDFQTNDDCSSENNAKRLEYDVKYKPSILYNNVGEIIDTGGAPGVQPTQTYNVNVSNNVDNSMAYLFLDVLDYYKKNHDKIITDLSVMTAANGIIDKAINACEITPTTQQSFIDAFEKMLFKMNDQEGRMGNNYDLNAFCNEINNIFTGDNNLKNYLLYGDEVNIDATPGTTKYPRTEPLVNLITDNTISGKDLTPTNYWNDIYDYNFMGILKRLSCVMRFYDGDNNKNENLIQTYMTKDLINGYQNWNNNKKNFIFNLEYFKDIYIIDSHLNNYINTSYLRNYFLKVIYQNCELENENHKITKEDKIKFIINSIYTLSYLLNHDITNPSNLKTEKTLDFGFMILGIASLKNFMPSSYFAISNIINNEDEDKWLDSFTNKFFKEYLSYYCKKNDDIVKLNNGIVIDYVKSLSIYKANKFAKDVIDDTTANYYDNTHRFIDFINTFDLEKVLPDTVEFEKLLKINYYIKKLEILIGTTEKGVLQDYLDKLKYETTTIEPVLHPYFIIDYLEEINFYNIGNQIIKAIHDNREELDKYKFNNTDVLTKYDALDFFNYVSIINETNTKYITTVQNGDGLKSINKDNIKNILLSHSPSVESPIADADKNLTDCYAKDNTNKFITRLQLFIEKLIEIKELFMYSFFDKLFGNDKYYIETVGGTTDDFNLIYKKNGPLFHHNNMMKHLQDCIEFTINYNISNGNGITNNMDGLIGGTKNTITMIIDIFRNELNNTVVPCFTYSDQNMIKNITDNIKKLETNKNKPNYEWLPTIYNKINNTGGSVSNISPDKHIFDYIYTLLNGQDEKQNYYLISNFINAGQNIFEKYSKDAKNNDTEFGNFHNNIINNGYLLNNVDININNEEIQFILESTKKYLYAFNTGKSAKSTLPINDQPVLNGSITITIDKDFSDVKYKGNHLIIEKDNQNSTFKGILESCALVAPPPAPPTYNLIIKNITNIIGTFDTTLKIYKIYFADEQIKDNKILFQYFMRKSSLKYFDYMINQFSNVNYNYIDKINAANKTPPRGNLLPALIDHTAVGVADKLKHKFIEKYDFLIQILTNLNKQGNTILSTTLNLNTITDFVFNTNEYLNGITNNINIIKNNYKILNDNNLFNIKSIYEQREQLVGGLVTPGDAQWLYFNLLNDFCIKEHFNTISDGIFNNFPPANEKDYIVEVIDQHIIKKNVVDKLTKSIYKIYNEEGVNKANINFTEIQGIINETNNIFNDIITNIRQIRNLFINRKAPYDDTTIQPIAHDTILNPESLEKYNNTIANVKEKNILYKKTQNEYDFVIDLLYGLEEGIKELFSLVPYNLNNPYVDKSLNHRNNLFIATNVLGYINTKLTDFSINNNTYLNIKFDALNALSLLDGTYLKDKTSLLSAQSNISILEPFFNKNNILEIKDFPTGNYTITTTNPGFIPFKVPTDNTTTRYPGKTEERCKVWTLPLFNFNNGAGGLGSASFKNPISRDVPKNIIMNFIKNNYYNATALPAFLTKTIIEAIEANFKDDNEITKFIKTIKEYYSNKKTIYNREISDAYKNVIKIIKDSNKANKDLLDNIITTKKYLQITPTQGTTLQPQVSYRLELDNLVDTNIINQDMGVLMNKLINSFANLEQLRNFIIDFVIEIFKKYVIYQCMSNKYSISMNQFTKVINDFTASATSTTANYNLSIYIYKFLKVLSENKNIDDLNNITDLIKYHKQIYNTIATPSTPSTPTISNVVKIFTNKYYGMYLKNIQDLLTYTPTSTAVGIDNNFYNEFGYINPEYFNIIMATYSKVLTLSQNNGTDIKYNHKYIINISNDNLIYSGLNENLNQIMKIYEKYKKKSKTPASNAILLDMIKEELLVDSYKKNAIDGMKYLTDFNSRIKDIFSVFASSINPGKQFLLEGGSIKEDKKIIHINKNFNKSYNDSKKRSRKLDYFILPKKQKSSIIIKRKKTKNQKHIISQNKKLTHTIQML